MIPQAPTRKELERGAERTMRAALAAERAAFDTRWSVFWKCSGCGARLRDSHDRCRHCPGRGSFLTGYTPLRAR